MILRILFFLLATFYNITLFANTNPPPANLVFQFKTKIVNPNSLLINAIIKPGFFLYKNKFRLSNSDKNLLELGALTLPEADIYKKNDFNKNQEIFKKDTALYLNILGISPGESIITLHYQGCSSSGFCYPPDYINIKISINSKYELSLAQIEEHTPQHISPSTDWTRFFQTNNYIFVLISFYFMGLLLSFTPCVLPMVPVLSSIIIGDKKNTSTWQAFLLSISYVVGMSTTYAIIGAVIASLGYNLQVLVQSFWVIVLMSVIFIVLAGTMFDLYEIKMPQALTTGLNIKTKWRYFNIFIMGAISILVLSPCVTPPLVGVLGYIAQTKNIMHGAISLFFLSLGMGTPLLLIATSAAKFVPKSGSWMHIIKKIFGVLLLLVAINLLTRLIPSNTHNIKTTTQLQTLTAWRNSIKNTPYFIEFYADWCTSCRIIEKYILQDSEIKKILKDKQFIKIDLTKNDNYSKEIMKNFNIIAPPVFIFYDKNNLEKTRLVGEFDKKTFIAALKKQ